MDQPTLTDAHRRLAELAGSWRGTEVQEPSPWSPGGQTQVTFAFRVVAEGFALAGEYESARDGTVVLRAHSVHSVDPATGEVLHHWFDSIGHPPIEPARGAFTPEGLVVERSSPRGVNRTVLRREGDVLLHEVAFGAPGAPPAPVARGRYERA